MAADRGEFAAVDNGPIRFRSKPAEIEAMRWTGYNARAIRPWMDQPSHQYGLGLDIGGASLWVKKSQRWIHLPVGDFIIAEPDGDGFYPCAAAIFEDRWEPLVTDSLEGVTNEE